MEKKIIFLELPTEVIEKIDDKNEIGSRSVFISDLVEKHLHSSCAEIHSSNEISTSMNIQKAEEIPGEVSLSDNKGDPLGKFNINTEEGFENLTEKIYEISNDPIVRMKIKGWR